LVFQNSPSNILQATQAQVLNRPLALLTLVRLNQPHPSLSFIFALAATFTFDCLSNFHSHQVRDLQIFSNHQLCAVSSSHTNQAQVEA
jgi:hypothetical protein